MYHQLSSCKSVDNLPSSPMMTNIRGCQQWQKWQEAWKIFIAYWCIPHVCRSFIHKDLLGCMVTHWSLNNVIALLNIQFSSWSFIIEFQTILIWVPVMCFHGSCLLWVCNLLIDSNFLLREPGMIKTWYYHIIYPPYIFIFHIISQHRNVTGCRNSILGNWRISLLHTVNTKAADNLVT